MQHGIKQRDKQKRIKFDSECLDLRRLQNEIAILSVAGKGFIVCTLAEDNIPRDTKIFLFRDYVNAASAETSALSFWRSRLTSNGV